MPRTAKNPLQHKVIINVDGSQAEARVVARLCKAICGKSLFDEIFESGQHIHKTVGGIIYNVPPSQIVKDNTPGARYYVAKRTMHAYDNGMGPDKFSILTGLSLNDAKKLLLVCEKKFPEVAKGYHPWVREQLQKNRTLVNAYGRPHTFLDRLDDELFRRGYSYYQQSSVGDHVKLAYGDFYYEKDPDWEADLLLTMHDSVTYQILPSPTFIWESVLLLKSFMERPMRILDKSDLSIPAEFSLGRSFRGLYPFKTKDEITHLLRKLRYANA